MSIYNMMYGVNPATFLILPMLGMHPDEYPRFRDCFVDDGQILVLTRVGGNNRNCGFGEEKLYKHPNFVKTYDSEQDSTYGYYVFSVPEKWKDDFERLLRRENPSSEYLTQMCKVFPKLESVFMERFGQNNKKP